MTNASFFDESQEQSQVKATIVSKYFWAWAKVIIATQKKYPARSSNRIAYIDLFAGPGRYKDGTTSTPLLVLEKATQDPDLCERLAVVLNDKDEANARSLEREIKRLAGVERLKHPPQIYHEEVGEQIVEMFTQMPSSRRMYLGRNAGCGGNGGASVGTHTRAAGICLMSEREMPYDG